MEINQVKFAKVVEAAKAKAAGNARWIAAIDKAVAGLASGWIVTELADGIMVTTESGETYRANGVCQCKAFEFNQPCKHRALARLIEMYNAEPDALSAPHDTRTCEDIHCDECVRLMDEKVERDIAAYEANVRAPRIVRSVERDVVSGCRVKVTRCDNWVI